MGDAGGDVRGRVSESGSACSFSISDGTSDGLELLLGSLLMVIPRSTSIYYDNDSLVGDTFHCQVRGPRTL